MSPLRGDGARILPKVKGLSEESALRKRYSRERRTAPHATTIQKRRIPLTRGREHDTLHTTPAPKGERSMDEHMTDEALNQYLESIAKVIELTFPNDETAVKAAEIVRDSKVKK